MAASTAPKRIDTHAHFVPPIFHSASIETGKSHLQPMDYLSITKSILSIASPGTSLYLFVAPNTAISLNEANRKLTPATNEFAADLKRRHPSRFGFWASVPLPDVEGALLELAYVLNELDADGVILFTNHHGYYLGDKSFEPFFQELDKRNANGLCAPLHHACVLRAPTTMGKREDVSFCQPVHRFQCVW